MRTLEQVWKIKTALAIAGTSQADIARKLGISEASVSLVVFDRSTSARVEAAINEAVGRDIFTEIEGNGGQAQEARAAP